MCCWGHPHSLVLEVTFLLFLKTRRDDKIMEVYYCFFPPRRLEKKYLVLFVVEHSAVPWLLNSKRSIVCKASNCALCSYCKSPTLQRSFAKRRCLHQFWFDSPSRLCFKVTWLHSPGNTHSLLSTTRHDLARSATGHSQLFPLSLYPSMVSTENWTKSSCNTHSPKNMQLLQLMQHSLLQLQTLLDYSNYKPMARCLIKEGTN